MTENILDPADCSTMAEVRAGVDDVDRRIVTLLQRRFGYMNAAARIKPDRSAVRDEWRKADVLAKVMGREVVVEPATTMPMGPRAVA